MHSHAAEFQIIQKKKSILRNLLTNKLIWMLKMKSYANGHADSPKREWLWDVTGAALTRPVQRTTGQMLP